MNFDYRPSGAIRSQLIPISIQELATNVVTDWMPGTPTSLALAFGDLLDAALESNSIMGGDIWTVRPVVARFERQWKQVTSWILGVAFSRKILEMEGYPWWAPVTAFTARRRRWAPLTPYWYPNLPNAQCRVDKPSPRLSRLMPDYVLARINSTYGGPEIAFAESKGSQQYLDSPNAPPISWVNQSRNAEFYYRNVPIAPAQQMLVATRVNPKAKHAFTRRLRVRMWNSKGPDSHLSPEAFREILLLHYFGVCERIGMVANAGLLALHTYTEMDFYPPRKRDQYVNRLAGIREELLEKARYETVAEKSEVIPGEPLFFSSTRGTYQIGDSRVRVGLSSPAMGIVKGLQDTSDELASDLPLLQLKERMHSLVHLSEKLPHLIFRADGVVSQLLE